jgi:tellurite resistance protein
MTLTGLKLTSAKKPAQTSPLLQRRNKLLQRLDEQIALATAQENGTSYIGKRLKTYTDKQTGLKQQIETQKTIKSWCFKSDTGKLCVYVRYGSKVLELAKGKNAVEVATRKELIETFKTLKSCVENGELDVQLEAASNSLRNAFVKD